MEAFLAKRKYADGLSNSWTNEFIAGIEREILDEFSVAATYTYRRYGNFLREVPFGITSADYIPAGNFHVDSVLGSFDVPYFVLGFEHDGTGIYTNVQDYRRSYHGLDLTVRKRMSQNFLISGSLTIQRQKAHYNSEDSLAYMPFVSGLTLAFDPTNVGFLNDETYAYFGRFGILPFSEWYLKVSGYYQLPWQIGVAGFLRYQQGYPFVIAGSVRDTTLFKFYGTSFRSILVEPFGSRRLENKFTLDLRVEKRIEIGRYGSITAIADIFNCTNANTVLRRNSNMMELKFNEILEVIAPRAVRFGLRYSF